MSYAYVYAPVSGTVTQDSHGGCDSSGGAAIDLGTSWRDVTLYLDDWYFKSIYIKEESDCCTNSDPSNFQRLLKVELYFELNCSGGYRGFVAFGHVKDVVKLGCYNITQKNFGKICETYLPGDCAPSCKHEGACTVSPCCYTANHLHMEADNGVEIVSYDQSVTAGTTAMYAWAVP